MAFLEERALILYLYSCFLVSLQDYILDHFKVASEIFFKLFMLLAEIMLEFLD